MSHMVVIKTRVKELDSLEAACKRLGVTLKRDEKRATYYSGREEICDHVIHVPGSGFGIAVKKRNGEYELSYDGYGQDGMKITQKVGQDLVELTRNYTAEEAQRIARIEGNQTSESVLENGDIEIRILVNA